MKYILIGLILICSGCHHTTKYSHSCPKPGHGPCYLCHDPMLAEKKTNNWKNVLTFLK